MSVLNYKFVIKGNVPLMMHSAVLSNPFSEGYQLLKPLMKKKNKTLRDYQLISDIEWKYGMYLNSQGEPCIPSKNLRRCFIKGATATKCGKKFESGAVIPDDATLIYDGPRSQEAMVACGDRFRHIEMKNVSRSKVPRTFSIFHDWSAEFTVQFDDHVIDGNEIYEAVDAAGRLQGVCEGRPQYGRFTIEDHKLSE